MGLSDLLHTHKIHPNDLCSFIVQSCCFRMRCSAHSPGVPTWTLALSQHQGLPTPAPRCPGTAVHVGLPITGVGKNTGHHAPTAMNSVVRKTQHKARRQGILSGSDQEEHSRTRIGRGDTGNRGARCAPGWRESHTGLRLASAQCPPVLASSQILGAPQDVAEGT